MTAPQGSDREGIVASSGRERLASGCVGVESFRVQPINAIGVPLRKSPWARPFLKQSKCLSVNGLEELFPVCFSSAGDRWFV